MMQFDEFFNIFQIKLKLFFWKYLLIQFYLFQFNNVLIQLVLIFLMLFQH